MMLYYAHPIDQTDTAHRIGNHAIVTDLLEGFEWVFDPAGAFHSIDAHYDERVQDINGIALGEADAVFAMLPRGVPTIGTVTEIHMAAKLDKPTLVYCQSRPIGLGRMPESVDFWMADERPANRHDDVREAVRTLRRRTEAMQARPIFLGPGDGDGDGKTWTAADQAAHVGDITGSELPDFCFSGPLGHTRKYNGDAAWDVPSVETVTLRIGERRRIKTGVFIAPPDDVWVSMVGRSSNFARGLLVEAGVIDSGWRGELEVKVYNLAGQPVTIEAGERIAQLIPHKIIAQQLHPLDIGPVEGLPYGDRGTNGWGSTGA